MPLIICVYMNPTVCQLRKIIGMWINHRVLRMEEVIILCIMLF